MSSKVILVTGGAGFIGSNFIDLILQEKPDWKIVCIDSLTYASHWYNILKVKAKTNFEKIDITDRKAVDKVFKKYLPDIVVNFAAESHVDNSINNPDIFIKTNVIGTQVLMDACLKYDVSRFHQVSTDEVYGDLPLNSTEKFTEKSILKPSNPYSASKASADLLALSYFRTFNLPVTISRCSNNYGPYQNKEKLIPHMIYKIKCNEKLPIYGTGENVRDWIYVEDHCRGILDIIEKGKLGEVYNLGANNERSNNEIVRLILKELDKSESLIEYVPDRKGHDLRYAIDASKAKNELGWIPKADFEQTMIDTINWYNNDIRILKLD